MPITLTKMSIAQIHTALEGMQLAANLYKAELEARGESYDNLATNREIEEQRTYNNCIQRIANDISNLKIITIKRNSENYWNEIRNPKTYRLILKPNPYQTRKQFIYSWVVSLLTTGNTYIYKQRDKFGEILYLHVLDVNKVMPLVASDSSIWYKIHTDNIAGINETITVPASEIIHDRANTFYHDLVGVSPLYAAASSVGASGNYVKGLTDLQIIEKLGWSSEVICCIFHVPPYMCGINKISGETLIYDYREEYFTKRLIPLIENIEILLSMGLNSDDQEFGFVFDINSLI